MAITATERTQIIELTVLMFEAAPGSVYLSQIVSIYESNGHNLQRLAETLGGTAPYASLNPNFQTGAEFAANLLTPLGLQNDAVAKDFVIGRFNSGESKGDIAYEALQALLSVTDGMAAQYVAARDALINKSTVAEYYSVTKHVAETNLGTLQSVISGVTNDDATVTAAQGTIDGTSAAGQTIVLTTNVDNVTGTAGNDTFVGSIDFASATHVATLNALDTINGAGGNNSLLVNVAGDTTINLGAGLVTNVQNLTVNSTDNALESSVNLNGNAFSNLTFVNPYDITVNGIQEGASVTQKGTSVAGSVNGEVYGDYYFDSTTATSVVMNDAVNGAGAGFYNEAYFYHGSSSADGNLANATSIVSNLSISNANIVSNDGYAEAYQYIYANNAGNAGASITVNLNSNDNASDGSYYSDIESYVYQTGDAAVTANINMINSVDTWMEVDAQEDGSATADASLNTANIVLNNVSGSYGDAGVGAYGFNTVNINVTGAAQLDDGLFFDEYNSTATDKNHQTLTITAGADLTSAETQLDGYGSTATTISGSGAVALGTYYASGNSVLSATGTVIAATIDASALTGNFSVDVQNDLTSLKSGSGSDKVSFTSVISATEVVDLGAGNDTLNAKGGITAGATLTGGAGTDTIGMASATWTSVTAFTAPQLAKISGWENLYINDSTGLPTATTYDLSKLAGLTGFVANGVVAAGTATVDHVGAGATVTLQGNLAANTGTLTVTMADATGTTDILNLVAKPNITQNNDATVDTTFSVVNVVAAGVETVNFTSTGKLSTAVTADNKTDNGVTALTLVDSALKSLSITGDQSVSYVADAGSTKLATLDASSNTGTAAATFDLHNSTVAVTLAAEAGAKNTIIGSSKGDTIVGGGKADTITGGTGADTMTGGAGNDKFVYHATGESTLLNLDNINDFSANTYGQGLDSTTSLPNGSATAAGADATSTKLTGDLIDLTGVAGTYTTIHVGVQANSSDAQTYLQNLATDSTVTAGLGAALDSSSGNVYIDVDHNGTADMVIHLVGVTTLTTAAFVV